MAASYGSVTEHGLQMAVLEHLQTYARPKVWWFSIPNAGKRSRWVYSQLKAEGMKSGVADLAIMLPEAHCAWLELKTERGRQTKAQKNFQEICEALGHPYCLARTIDQAIAFLKHIGALR